MAPKKKDEGPKERPVLGRFRTNLKVIDTLRSMHPRICAIDFYMAKAYISHHRCAQVGIVGLPNVGKSTLFNTLTKMGIPAENFPFCTIEPNNVWLYFSAFYCTLGMRMFLLHRLLSALRGRFRQCWRSCRLE